MAVETEATFSNKDDCTNMSFRILDLPPELGNLIYIQVVESVTCAFLHPRDRGNLATPSSLPRVSHQIRQEFLAILYRHTDIFAIVKDFDFSHVISFFDRLRPADLATLPTKLADMRRTFTIAFELTESENLDRRGLDSWYGYMKDPTKKGSKVAIGYTMLPTTNRHLTWAWWGREFSSSGPNDKSYNPVASQIIDAFGRFLLTADLDELSDGEIW